MKRAAFVASAAATLIPRTRADSADAVRPFRIAVDMLGNGLDPYRNYGGDVDQYAWLYGDGLTTGERSARAMLAELPEIRDGGRTYRYTLRPVRWHDGATLLARHVVEAFTGLHSADSPWMTYEPYASVRDIATRDNHTVDVRLSHTSHNFARTFFSPYGNPALPLLRHDGDGTVLGTGPFRVVQSGGGRVRLDAWTGSPRGNPRSAALDVRLVPSAQTLALELASSEVDLALPIVRGFSQEDAYRIVSRHHGTTVLLFNCSRTFNSRAYRQAVLRALDIDQLQKIISPDRDVRVDSLLPPGSADDVAFPFPPVDTERARAELQGIDQPVTITYPAESRRYGQLALFIASMLKDVGVATSIVPRVQAIYESPIGPLRAGWFDLAIYGFAYPESPNLAADWGCATRPPHGANHARYCSADFERFARAGNTSGALQTLVNDIPFIPIARNVESFGIGPRTLGFTVPAPFVPATLGVAQWRRE